MTAHNVSIRNQAWFSDDKLCAVVDRAYSGSSIRHTTRGLVKFSGSVVALCVAALIQTVAIGQQSAVLRSVDVYGTDLFSGDEVAREYKADVDVIAAAFATFPSNSELAGRS